MVPDMAMESKRPQQLDSAHGPLSVNQSKAILAKLKKDGDETNIFDKHLAVEAEIVGSPLVTGNKVELLIDGAATYAAMLDAIKHAKDHINMETYIIENDEIGNLFAQSLIEKQLTGVQINLIYDSFGSSSTPHDFFDKLKQSGVNVLEYNPINPLMSRKGWQFNQRDHRKLLIIDGKQAFLGGINISSVYSSGSFKNIKDDAQLQPWRDTHLHINGPVVAEFQTLFIDTWHKQQGEPMLEKSYFPAQQSVGQEVVRAIGSSPDEEYSQIYATLLSAINSAESQIFLTNAYFVPDVKLLTALKDAVKRGVDTRLLLPDKTDSLLIYYASRSFYDELLSAGVKIYERQDALLHAKTAVIDGVWSTVGSTNLDWRSFVHNQEINAVILGQDFGAQMRAMFEKDLAASKTITLDAWRKRPIGARIKEKAARIWATWL
jgi:cardiolipin synthase